MNGLLRWNRRGWTPCPLLMALLACVILAGCGAPAERPAPSAPAITSGTLLVRVTGMVEREGATDHGGIQVYLPGTSQVALTDGQGRYALGELEPGDYVLMARAEGYAPTTVSQLVIDPSSTQPDLALATVRLQPLAGTAPAAAASNQPGVLRGRVSSSAVPAGTVIDWSGCSLLLEGTAFRTAPAPGGEFLFWSLPPGAYRLTARMEGYAPWAEAIDVRPGPAETSTAVDLLPLSPQNAATARRIFGLVTLLGPAGQPTNDFDRVIVEVVGRPDLATTLAPDGTFTLPPVPPARYTLTARAEGYSAASPVEVDVTTLPEMEVQLTLGGGSVGTGKVRLRGMALKNVEGETDMSGITVALAGTSLMATTDRDGNYVMDGVTSGSFTLIGRADGYLQAEAEIEIGAGVEQEAPGLLLEPERDYPRVVGTELPDGASELVVRREIPLLVRFSKDMNASSLATGIRIEPDVAWKVELVERDIAQITLSGWGEAPIAKFNTRYRVTLGTEVADDEGLTLQEPYRFSFTTGRPSVIDTKPEDRADDVNLSLSSAVSLRFNAIMDPKTMTPDQIRIRPRLGSEPVLSVADDPQTGWSTLQIRGDWKPDTQYRITLERRARTLTKDSLSNTPYTFSFRTAKMKTYDQPQRPRSGSSGMRY